MGGYLALYWRTNLSSLRALVDQNQSTGLRAAAVCATDALKHDVSFVPKGLNQAN